MNPSIGIMRWVERFLPAPFSLAVLLTALVAGLIVILQPDAPERAAPPAVVLHGHEVQLTPEALAALESNAGISPPQPTPDNRSLALRMVSWWYGGFWSFLTFGMQMALILVLGYVVAISPWVSAWLSRLAKWPTNTASAAALVAFVAVFAGLINWGLGLIVGAVLARKVGEEAQRYGRRLHYPLIGAAGYTGLMVWHGGLSGSAPLKVAEPGHFLEATVGLISAEQTLGSTLNIAVAIGVLVLVPTLAWLLGKKLKSSSIPLPQPIRHEAASDRAPWVDRSRWVGYGTGLVLLIAAIVQARSSSGHSPLAFLQLNWINFTLFGLAIAMHGSLRGFVSATDKAIAGAAGILIQFPLYAGIMGLMASSGLLAYVAEGMIAAASADTLPIFTFFSAGLVNIVVPSGGGQWGVQGPVIMEAAAHLGSSPSLNVMALAYGDQLTNMIQPFWAIPLLAITGLRAQQLLPYTFLFMLVGAAIMLGAIVVAI